MKKMRATPDCKPRLILSRMKWRKQLYKRDLQSNKYVIIMLSGNGKKTIRLAIVYVLKTGMRY